MEEAHLLAAYILSKEEEEEETLLCFMVYKKANKTRNPLFYGTARRVVSDYSHPETSPSRCNYL